MTNRIWRTNTFQTGIRTAVAVAALVAGPAADAAIRATTGLDSEPAASVGATGEGYVSQIFGVPPGFVRAPGYSAGPYDPTGPRLGTQRPTN
jgi:hypothetical protein